MIMSNVSNANAGFNVPQCALLLCCTTRSDMALPLSTTGQLSRLLARTGDETEPFTVVDVSILIIRYTSTIIG